VSEVDPATSTTSPRHVDGYAIGFVGDARPRMLAKIGGLVLDLDRLEQTGRLAPLDLPDDLFRETTLNRFMSFGHNVWRELEELLTELRFKDSLDDALFDLGSDPLYRPLRVADYCDFYASENHTTNIGRILRPGSDPLPAAWRHIPLGYHGRSGTVVVSGTTLRRPEGVVATPNGPTFGPTSRLDLEVELGFVVGGQSKHGRPVPVDEALDHIFGVVLVNDWSARDIQAFEYQPLGPFLGKSFQTSISPWVVPLSALEKFRVDGPPQGREVPDHLRAPQPRAFDIHLELSINSTVVSRPEARYLHWSPEQLVAHLTSNGAPLATGDLLATGTISGPEQDSWGSLMELGWGGERPISLDDGSTRAWLEDGDTVTIRAWCGDDHNELDGDVYGDPGSLDLGTVTGNVRASRPDPGD
jgi:fumarylacetoacetase